MALTLLVSAPILIVGGIIMAIRQDVPLSGLLVVVLPIMVAFIAVVMYRAIPLFRAMQTKLDRINQVMRETLAGVRVIRAFVRTEHEEQRFDDANRDLFDTSLRVNRLFAITIPVMTAILNLSTVAVMWFGAMRVDSGQMPIGNLTAFLQYLMQILFSVLMAVFMFIFVPRAAVSAGRIQEVLGTVPSIRDPERPAVLPQVEGGGRVEFRNVEFRLSRRRAAGPARHLVRGPTRRDHRDRGQHRQRQVDAGEPDPALLRRDRAARSWSTAWTSGR